MGEDMLNHGARHITAHFFLERVVIYCVVYREMSRGAPVRRGRRPGSADFIGAGRVP